MKYTEWFPGHIKPVRVGVYETGMDGKYQFWNGNFWGYCCFNPKDADDGSKFGQSISQNERWRGLTEPHAET